MFTRLGSKTRNGILITFSPLAGIESEEKVKIAGELDTVLKREIEKHKNTQVILKDQTAKMKAIFDSTALFIWTVEKGNIITSYNERFEKNMLRWFDKKVELGMLFFEEPFAENMNAAGSFEYYVKKAFNGNQEHFEVELYTAQEDYVWVEIFIEPIIGEDKTVKEVSFIAFETTEKKQVERQIASSLQEKETLLQEVHHRVKNNLQIISSILNLQSSYVKDENSLIILKESQNRIKSMSFIHETLYMSKNFGSIEVGEYIKGLTRNLIHSYSINSNDISLVLDTDEVELSLDQAIPCGLIINEIVSNALKYAFPENKKGKIEVSVKEEAGVMKIYIADDGIGMKDDFDIEESDSLGLQLIYTLTEQLDGGIEFSGEKGTKYLITFEKIIQKRTWPEPVY